jgi:hypothetical protein
VVAFVGGAAVVALMGNVGGAAVVALVGPVTVGVARAPATVKSVPVTAGVARALATVKSISALQPRDLPLLSAAAAKTWYVPAASAVAGV